jgi:hypothetical protein
MSLPRGSNEAGIADDVRPGIINVRTRIAHGRK